MKKYTKPLPLIRRWHLTREEFSIYKMDMREYRVVNGVPLRGIKLRKNIYPMVNKSSKNGQ